jgi:hippurate hydrolase
MTSFLGTAKMLTELKSRWSGTLVMLGQPAEETGDGANAMLRDNLYSQYPEAGFCDRVARQTRNWKQGRLVTRPGYAMASATSIDIKIRGIGGHGSAPELAKDPIVVAAQGRHGFTDNS